MFSRIALLAALVIPLVQASTWAGCYEPSALDGLITSPASSISSDSDCSVCLHLLECMSAKVHKLTSRHTVQPLTPPCHSSPPPTSPRTHHVPVQPHLRHQPPSVQLVIHLPAPPTSSQYVSPKPTYEANEIGNIPHPIPPIRVLLLRRVHHRSVHLHLELIYHLLRGM
jgi:hypothetical protein